VAWRLLSCTHSYSTYLPKTRYMSLVLLGQVAQLAAIGNEGLYHCEHWYARLPAVQFRLSVVLFFFSFLLNLFVVLVLSGSSVLFRAVGLYGVGLPAGGGFRRAVGGGCILWLLAWVLGVFVRNNLVSSLVRW